MRRLDVLEDLNKERETDPKILSLIHRKTLAL